MRDAAEVLDLDLELPVRGKTYRVLPPPAAVGVRLCNMLALGMATDAVADLDIPDARELTGELAISTASPDFARDCLGPVYDEMLADDVPAPMVELAIGTAFFVWTVGRAVAEGYWETGGKAPAPTTRTGRPTATPARPDGAPTTRSRASRSGTRTPTRSPGKASPSPSSGDTAI